MKLFGAWISDSVELLVLILGALGEVRDLVI